MGAYRHASEVPEVLREVLYCHEVLRAAGIPSRDIYVTHAVDGIAVFVKRGTVEVAVAGYPTGMTDEEFESDWPRAVQLWNQTCNDPSAGWDLHGSATRQHAVEIVALTVLAQMEPPSGALH